MPPPEITEVRNVGATTPALGLQCANRNYLSSLVIVREEHAPRLPVYHRRVPIPLDHMDATGTNLPQKSTFRNGGRQVMIRCRTVDPAPIDAHKAEHAIPHYMSSLGRANRDHTSQPSEGFHQWQPHHLCSAVAPPHPNDKKQRCTFGVPNVKPRESPPRETHHNDESCRECTKPNCACHNEIYESVFGSIARQRSGTMSIQSPSPQPGELSGSVPSRAMMRKFLAPLRNVKSHNLFQKLISLPSKGGMARTSLGGLLDGSLSSLPELPTADAAMGSTNLANDQALNTSEHDLDRVVSMESTVASYSSVNRPPPTKLTRAMIRGGGGDETTVDTDLNHAVRVLTELEAFEHREVLRKEREEFLKSSNPISLSSMRKSL